MLQRLSLGFATLLLAITIIAAVNTPTRNTDTSLLFASYEKRFQEGDLFMFIEWIMPADLSQLAKFSDVIVLGTVVQRVVPPPGLGIEGEVFEISVNTYLKAPEYADPQTILVSQIVGEGGNPVIQPGDECVFFLTPFYLQKPGPGVVYSLGGDYTRYFVYGGRVYSVASLNPRNVSSESLVRGEPLTTFFTRVKNMARYVYEGRCENILASVYGSKEVAYCDCWLCFFRSSYCSNCSLNHSSSTLRGGPLISYPTQSFSPGFNQFSLYALAPPTSICFPFLR